MTDASLVSSELIEVRRSNVHGLGVFAAQKIVKGTRIIEYVGERVSHDEADRRYEDKDENDSHTFLFIVDRKTVIDAGVEGNDARYFNHSCDPNCESVVEERRVYIEAIRDIDSGAELTYDYQIQREDDDPDNIDEVFACRCGFAQCRGTMLWPTERKPKRAARGKAGAAKKEGKSAASKSRSAAKKTSAGKTKSAAQAKSAGTASGKTKSAGKKAAGKTQSPANKKSAAAGRKPPVSKASARGRPAGKRPRPAGAKRSATAKGSGATQRSGATRRTSAAKRSGAAKRGGRRR
jgi:hypothetical protein